MADWLIEQGIGETRAVRIEGGEIVEARVFLDGVPRAGSTRTATLKRAGRPAIAVDGEYEYLLPKGAPGITEGAQVTIEITREPMPGPEPWKRPFARVADALKEPACEGAVVAFPAPEDHLEQAGWPDLLEEARSGIVRFEGGELRIAPTPAMTLIDVDGTLPPNALAIDAAEVAAKSILRHGIGGSIGIDFPTVQGKSERQAVAAAVDAVLPQPFERTAVNGFGFLQIVRPRRHASLIELAADRAPFEARALLRSAAFASPGSKRLVAHPAVISVLEGRPQWVDALARQVGGTVSLRGDPALPMSGGHAEPA